MARHLETIEVFDLRSNLNLLSYHDQEKVISARLNVEDWGEETTKHDNCRIIEQGYVHRLLNVKKAQPMKV